MCWSPDTSVMVICKIAEPCRLEVTSRVSVPKSCLVVPSISGFRWSFSGVLKISKQRMLMKPIQQRQTQSLAPGEEKPHA